ncbi:MAG: ATPase, T2SS/T4P/T4SS family [Atribacterota bacterium]|nr:ATPase, T2SS/T4P/T4SS family [Atribacterota bacterium]MDD4289236.1 ATPase, T2SS/T4P/T4SS family [Atribacterota bacterium]MDD4765387.1 ATPase, T2SS/T4P/T4SS family [Atribacterota bacterium]
MAGEVKQGKYLANLRLGEILINQGLINSEQLKRALEAQKTDGKKKLGEILVSQGILTQKQLLQALQHVYEAEYIELDEVILDPEIVTIIPKRIAVRYKIVPLSKENGTLTIAMANPLDVNTIDYIKEYTKLDVVPKLASEEDISNALSSYYEAGGKIDDILEKVDVSTVSDFGDEVNLSQLEAISQEAPVIQLVNMIIVQAIKERASDIHLEPNKRGLLVRYRIDGILHDIRMLPARIKPAIISRVKILSRMDIAERRLPQDGRFQLKFGAREVDLRISSIPTVYEEKIVMRLLDKSQGLISLENTGFTKTQLQEFRSMISSSYGIILITGPTGSGKSTTLYGALNEIDSVEKNVITVEDPVEYKLERVNQINVLPKINLTFANALRSILRQDPDIIMIGEMRDSETAHIAVQSALTGHLVFSTLHTNDAVSSLTRMIDMGIAPFLISSSVVGVMAQRLVRKICPKCIEEYFPEKGVLDNLKINFEIPNQDNLKFYRGKGCDYCKNTGYRGRTALFEVVRINDEIRSMIMKNTSSNVIKDIAIKNGMRTLLDSGIQKVLSGETTIDEVLRVAV